MAAHVVVIDSSFRSTKVKVTPATYMTDILQEACKKWNFNSSSYGLKNKTKQVDLSLTFRQTGLSSGAKLELIVGSKSPSVVSVALQIPDPSGPGRRVTDKVPSDTTMWRILRKFESSEGTNSNFTARGIAEVSNGDSGAGRIYYEMPTLNVVGRELSTFGDLQKTLAQIGINGGSVLIKMNFRKTDQPLEEAMAEIGQYFKTEEEEVASGASSSEAAPKTEVEGITQAIARMDSVEPSGGDTEMNNEVSETTAAGESIVTPLKRSAPVEEKVLGPNQRPIAIYSAPSSDTPKAALQPHNENDYEPSIAHAKLHQSRLLNSTQNKRLLSDAEVEQAEKEKVVKLATIKNVEIKLRFPDQTTIVGSFTADETAAVLYDFVSSAIVASDQPFKLVWTNKGPQTIPRDEKNSKKKLIKDLGLEGRVLVNLVWEDGASESARNAATLKPQYAEKAQEMVVPEAAIVETKDDEVPIVLDKGKGKETSDGGASKPKGVPKWLKGLSKK